MLSPISAYRAMQQASASEAVAGKENGAVVGVHSVASVSPVSRRNSGSRPAPADVVDISASKDVFTAVESFFNMGKTNRFEDFHNLSREDKEKFITIVAELAKSGYMGYEELVVDNKVERHEIAHQMGDDRIRGAKVYDENKERIR